MRTRYLPQKVALGGLGLLAVAAVIAGLDGWGQPAANEQAIGAASRWCERVSGGYLREPVNTLGNLGFVISGLAMFVMLGKDEASRAPRTNRFIGHQPLILLFASAALFLGPGSMAMHGSHTRFGAWLDNLSMICFILIPWLINVADMARWTTRTLFVSYGSLVGLYGLGYWFAGPDLGIGLDLFGLSIGLWVTSEALYRWHSPAMRALSGLVGFAMAAAFGVLPGEIFSNLDQYWWVALFWLPGLLATHAPPGRRTYVPWFWLGMVSFISAYAIWLTGTADHPWCSPDSLIQAHAIWHILGAVATWCFFLFLRTEQSVDADTDIEVSADVMPG